MRLLLLTSMHILRCLFVTIRTDFEAALNDCLGKKNLLIQRRKHIQKPYIHIKVLNIISICIRHVPRNRNKKIYNDKKNIMVTSPQRPYILM